MQKSIRRITSLEIKLITRLDNKSIGIKMSEDPKKVLSPKAGYNQHTTPTINKSSASVNIASSSLVEKHRTRRELSSCRSKKHDRSQTTISKRLQVRNGLRRSKIICEEIADFSSLLRLATRFIEQTTKYVVSNYSRGTT
jgi:hypothetical protein